MEDLKDCPFCGYKARSGSYYDDYNDLFYIEGTNDDCGICVEKIDQNACMKIWNRRYEKTNKTFN